ncbi:MAG: hypothetical protein OEN21_10565 [Myxococcales bacterium]|nr:hypothetical protein [Myxococcales bacterium]
MSEKIVWLFLEERDASFRDPTRFLVGDTVARTLSRASVRFRIGPP